MARAATVGEDAGVARSSRWFSWLLLLLACALVVRAGVRDRGVIVDHLEFGRRLLAGTDLYAPYLESKPLHPPYPPSFGLMTAPFSLLSERVARWVWAVVQAVALVYVLRWLRHALAQRWPHASIDVVLLLSLGLGARFVLRDTHGGGGNLINLAMVSAAFASSARGNPVAGGLWLGSAGDQTGGSALRAVARGAGASARRCGGGAERPRVRRRLPGHAALRSRLLAALVDGHLGLRHPGRRVRAA